MRKDNCRPERLGTLLEERGISPEALAKGTDIPIATIRGYLFGRREAISTRNMLLFANFFQMPMSQLVDYLAGVDAAEKSETKGCQRLQIGV